MPWYGIVMIVLTAISALSVVSSVGKPRAPVTSTLAVFTLISSALWIWGTVALAN